MRKNILCYGDSNTWGTIPRWAESDIPSERYPEEIRWPCVLQKLLGEDFRVIEEGLGGRTTIYSTQAAPWKNGETTLLSCLFTHRPLDLVILMLGSNDLQKAIQPPLERLGDGISRLTDMIQGHPNCGRDQKIPEILILAPTFIKPSAPNGRVEVYPRMNGDTGRELSLAFPRVYAQVAREKGCRFLDASQYAQPSDADGVHFTPQAHLSLGRAVAAFVQEQIFPETACGKGAPE